MDAERFRFLYRQSEGEIDAAQWRRAIWPPALIALAMTGVWLMIAPAGPRDMATQPFFDWRSIVIFSYFLIYVFALLLCAVTIYFVNAKRFANAGWAREFAGLALMGLFLAAAANWYQPRSEGSMPEWATLLFDLAAIGALAWSLAQLAWAKVAARTTR